MTSDPQRAVAFRSELPIPRANADLYEKVYELEQWYRRVAYAAMMARHGVAWREALAPGLLAALERRLHRLPGHAGVDRDDGDNAIWLLTLGELQTVLLKKSIRAEVQALTGLDREVLDAKLSQLREVRNVVAHNSAIGPTTSQIAATAIATLQHGVETFRDELLYDADATIHIERANEATQAEVPARFANLTEGNDWSRFQPMLSESEFFFSLTRLPCQPFDQYVDVRRLLSRFAAIRQGVLAVLVNKSGDEFTLAWPKHSGADVHERILGVFFTTHAHVWTKTPYERQDATAVCNPIIWFYENQRPQ